MDARRDKEAKQMTVGINKLNDNELLKVVMCIADMAKSSIAEVAEKLEDKDRKRLIKSIIINKNLWQ